MKLGNKIKQIYLDINNFQKLNEVMKKEKPDIIFHLAAQPLIFDSYKKPHLTIDINVRGTLNILDTIKKYNFVPPKNLI